jgi:hypothetical protein
MAGRAGIAAAEGNGSSPGPASIDRKGDKSRRIPAAFSFSLSAGYAGDYPVSLLDIGGSLC